MTLPHDSRPGMGYIDAMDTNLTPQEVADQTGLSLPRIYQLAHKLKLGTVRDPHLPLLFAPSDVEKIRLWRKAYGRPRRGAKE